jgi:hypothetical protein
MREITFYELGPLIKHNINKLYHNTEKEGLTLFTVEEILKDTLNYCEEAKKLMRQSHEDI